MLNLNKTIRCGMPNCSNVAAHYIEVTGDRYFYCADCRASFETYTWKYFKPLELLTDEINGINFNLRKVFNGKPILCQLVCDSCKIQYCGSWRNDWNFKVCRECEKGKVTPIIDYQFFERHLVNLPQKESLN